MKLWDRRKASPSRLSGGQKQRLATADALAGLPACLVLDEPTAMLDPDSRKEVINIVKELNRKEEMTIILITHHTDEVVDADRIVLMKDGKIIGDDIPKKIFADYELLKKAKMDIDFDEYSKWLNNLKYVDEKCDNCFYSINCNFCSCPKIIAKYKRKSCVLEDLDLKELINLYDKSYGINFVDNQFNMDGVKDEKIRN